MALLFMDGFDYYNTNSLAGAEGAGWDIGSTTSGYALGVYGYGQMCSQGAGQFSKTLSSNLTTIVVGWHHVPTSAVQNTNTGYSFMDGASTQCSFRFTSAGALEFWRGTGTALLGTTPAVLKPGAPAWVSIKITFSGSVGTCLMQVNGATVLNLTGLNNITTANAYCNKLILNNGVYSWYIDNCFICDTTGSAPYNDILAERRIYFLMPTGAGTASQFTPTGAATFWQCTDEVPSNGDTDYGSSTTPGNRSDTTRAALTGPSVVDAVKYNLTTRKDDAGVRTLSPTVRQGGTYYDTTAVSLSAVYQVYPTYYLTQPSGAGVWSLAALNAAEFGVLDAA